MKTNKPGAEIDIGCKVRAGIPGKTSFSGVVIQKRTVTIYDVQYDDGEIGVGLTRDMLDVYGA